MVGQIVTLDLPALAGYGFRLVIEIPKRAWLSANDRHHWREEDRRTGWLRELARRQAQYDNLPKNLPVPLQSIAHVSTPSRRIEDPNNANPTTKALIDGLTDHHCWADDDDKHVLGPDHRRGPLTPGRRIVALDLLPLDGAVRPLRACKRCGCTEAASCEPFGCWWVKFDLCSSCATPDDIQKTRRR